MFLIEIYILFFFYFFKKNNYIFTYNPFFLYKNNCLFYELNISLSHLFFYIVLFFIFFERLYWLFYIRLDNELTSLYWWFYLWIKWILIFIFLLLLNFIINYFFLYYQIVFFKNIGEFFSLKNYFFSYNDFFNNPFEWLFIKSYKVQIIKCFFNIYLIKRNSFQDQLFFCYFIWDSLNSIFDMKIPFPILFIHNFLKINTDLSIYEIKKMIIYLFFQNI